MRGLSFETTDNIIECDNFVKERFRGVLFYCAVYNAEADEEVWA